MALSDTNRRLSIDVMRGMLLWISFIAVPLPSALKELSQSTVVDIAIRNSQHANWNGFSFIDAGFPAYMILLAISMTFSYERRKQAGATRHQVLLRILSRAGLLWLFAFFFDGPGFSVPWQQWDFTGVFFRLSFCIFITGILLLYMPRRWYFLALIAFFLIYWALLTLVTIPRFGYADFSKQRNAEFYLYLCLARYLTQYMVISYTFLAQIWWYLMLPQTIGVSLIGLMIGQLLISNRTLQQQALILLMVGTLSIEIAVCWDHWLPINKHLWTPSFMLLSGGMACVALGGVMQVVEVWRWKKISSLFTVFGRSPLLAWFCFFNIVPFKDLAQKLAGAGFPAVLGSYHSLVLAILPAILCWFFLKILQGSFVRAAS